MDVLFGGSNHIEKGGNLLHVENAHHANITGPNDDLIRETEAPRAGSLEKREGTHIEEVKR